MQAWHSLIPSEGAASNGENYGTELPDIPDEYGHLPEFLYAIGVVGQGFDSLAPLTFLEIEAWSRMTGAELNRFEAETIRAMSVSYCAIANKKDSECPIPDGETHNAIEKANIASWAALSA